MAIAIRNEHLEQQVENERVKRGHATLTGTAEELLIERLTQLTIERRQPSPCTACGDQRQS